jgi:hypothetical protein
MEHIFPKLLVWVDQEISPAGIHNRTLLPSDFQNWRSFVESQATQWRLQLSAFLLSNADLAKKKDVLRVQLQQLVRLSNLVNAYLFKDRKWWGAHPSAAQIKEHYAITINFIEEMLRFAQQDFPQYDVSDSKVSNFRLRAVLPGIRTQLSNIQKVVLDYHINNDLVTLILKTLKRISAPGNLCVRHISYINKLAKEIGELKHPDDPTVEELLIKLDFNQPECYLYFANKINGGMNQLTGIHEEIDKVTMEKENVRNQYSHPNWSLHPESPSLKEELLLYYSEKIAYLEHIASNRRQAMQDKVDAEHAFRMLISMSVPQFALFLRVLKETQVILKNGMTEICTFFAMHFYTDKAPFISSSNLLKRSSDVEFTTVLKLWDTLTAMLEWLDKNFNVRDYRRSL